MKLFNLNDFKGGWVVGDFLPTILKTKEFEVSIKHYKAGQTETSHCHKIADEITIIVTGSVLMNDIQFQQNDIVLIEKGEFTNFIPLTDCITCVIKIPSVIGDKYDFYSA